MNKLAVVVFDSERQACEGSRGIRVLDQEGTSRCMRMR